MGKSLYIAEKPSVAQEFAKALNIYCKEKRRISGIGRSHCDVVRWASGYNELSGSV